MKDRQASAEKCRSPAAVGEQPSTRPNAATGERSASSGGTRHLRLTAPSVGNGQSGRTSPTEQPRSAMGVASGPRRLERDLHDGVQSELVALIVKLAVAQQDPSTPRAVADMLAGIEDRAQAVLDSVRDIARGIYPPVLADFGLRDALRAHASRVAVPMNLAGTAPRSGEEAEHAVYFACSEALQNVVKHGGDGCRVSLRLNCEHGSLVVRISDNGRGFDPAHTIEGAGLQNIRDRIERLGGTVKLASKPCRGTVLTLSLPWPTRSDRVS